MLWQTSGERWKPLTIRAYSSNRDAAKKIRLNYSKVILAGQKFGAVYDGSQ
jgi:hypothetical protein